MDDLQIRGIKILSDIYQQSNVAFCNPTGHDESLQAKKIKLIHGERDPNDQEKQNLRASWPTER